MKQIPEILEAQRSYFATGKTLSLEHRRSALLKLKNLLIEHESEIFQALKTDLNKSTFEAYGTEIGMVNEELNFILKHLNSLVAPKKKPTPLLHFPSKSQQRSDPYGCVLIISPWNYPFMLTITPIIGAIAAGNCIIVKPSEYSPATSNLICKILSFFPDQFIATVEGGQELSAELLEQRFDFIFFTGSTNVGRLVMEKAAKYLTPVTLELGGKSPCIVDETAKIEVTARRIVWGKLVNSGQTCVAPDYLLVHESVKDRLVVALKKYIIKFYGEHPEQNPDYPKIINEKHFQRLLSLIPEKERQINVKTLQISPVILENSTWDSDIMKDEIFGPILPILTYTDLNDAMRKINQREKPLALYLFTNSKAHEKQVLSQVSFGGGCVNDCIIHLANSHLPFGGVGASGTGAYHGKQSFYCFSHQKSITKKSLALDVPVRYPPYGKNITILRWFM
ncbi:MAG: aldehyde dehydrogenase [Eubacteriales bacterium]